MTSATGSYYLPHQAKWPILASTGLFCFLGGFAAKLIGIGAGAFFMVLGLLLIVGMMVGWFGEVINEGLQGLYNPQVDRSFRWGMIWFIASEVMFFACFFGSLFYFRAYVIPWLGGEGPRGLAPSPTCSGPTSSRNGPPTDRRESGVSSNPWKPGGFRRSTP